MGYRNKLKDMLGSLPLTAEVYWQLRGQYKPWSAHYKLDGLNSVLPEAVADVQNLAKPNPDAKKICLFASLHYWIEQAGLIGLALSGQGHQVSLGYLPYADWDKPISKFDLRRQDLYTQKVFTVAAPVMEIVPLLNQLVEEPQLSPELQCVVEQVSNDDAQYTLQVEKIDTNCDLYRLRCQRNRQAAATLADWFTKTQPDVVIVPNGTILEMGVAYQVARHLGIQTVTFEFADQRERIWLAQDSQIMSHDTSALWQALGNQPLPEPARQALIELFSARKNAKLWGSFARQWQQTPQQGASKVKEHLGLDERPVVLLATNVLGDSMTLGRQQISDTMADWIIGTIRFFLDRKDAQLVIRIHPGELLTHGTSMVEVIDQVFPELSENIHLVRPEDKTNTYDIIEVIDLGLVYTTTVGLEMSMAGLPVVVAGKTHYARKGFTFDPDTWGEYEQILNRILAKPAEFRLNAGQVEQAWLYAYLFFFEFSLPFPWHLLWLGQDFKTRPISFVLSPEGQARYVQTFSYLTGEPLDWSARGFARLQELPPREELPHVG